MPKKRYPKIQIRSKNELAKHLSGYRMSTEKATQLITDVCQSFDQYWLDYAALSQPDKGKWVRDASKTKLGKLLRQINNKVLKPHDRLLPGFIFGGISGFNHKTAVEHLLGRKKKRILLKLDITKFFEQIRYERIYNFFLNKCACSHNGAKLLAGLCCVPYGPKEKPADYKTIARGFSTSPRLAVWCNLDTFLKLERLVKKELKGKDPRIAIYVDDIGITASKATKEDMVRIYSKIEAILKADKHQRLPLNENKTKIINYTGKAYDIAGRYLGRETFEHLGLQMNRNSLTPGMKTKRKLADLKNKLGMSHGDKTKINLRRKAIQRYKNYIEKK